jgi:hypothetical protein
MGFVLSHEAACGKLNLQDSMILRLEAGVLLFPAVDEVPPQQAHPFVNAGFSPLPMRPPMGSKLGCVVRCGDGKPFSRKLVAKNAESSAGVEV